MVKKTSSLFDFENRSNGHQQLSFIIPKMGTPASNNDYLVLCFMAQHKIVEAFPELGNFADAVFNCTQQLIKKFSMKIYVDPSPRNTIDPS